MNGEDELHQEPPGLRLPVPLRRLRRRACRRELRCVLMARGGDGNKPDPDINDTPHPNPPVPLRPIPPITPPEPKP